MRRGLHIVLSIAGLLAVAFGIYAWLPLSRSQGTAAPARVRAPRPVPVHLTTVQRGTIRHQTTATGDILAAARVEVLSKVEGRLQSLLVELGDAVQAGQVIARVAGDELQARAERAAAELDALRAEWAQMQAGARPEEIAQAEDRVRQTAAELQNAERLLSRTRALVQRGLRSTQDLEDITLRVTLARAAHGIADKRLRLLRAGARREDRQALQARLRAAQAALRLAQTELQNATITAPITGVVSQRHVDLGAYITDRTPIVTIVDMDTVKIKTPISERDLGALRPDLPALLRVDAYPDVVFEGRVRRIGPTVDPASRSGEVEIVAANPDHRLKPGMFAKVTLILEQRQDVLVVPRQAVWKQGEAPALFVVRDGRAHLQSVRLGLWNNTHVELLTDLAPGTSVVLAGQHKLKDQARVRVVSAEESS